MEKEFSYVFVYIFSKNFREETPGLGMKKLLALAL